MTVTKPVLRGTLFAAWCAASSAAFAADWSSAGHDLNNSRYQDKETRISPATVGGLTLRWAVNTSGDVTANPAIDKDHVYFPDSAGFLYKLDRKTGAVEWKRPVSDYTGIPGDFARATPAIVGDTLILGNQSGKFLQAWGQPAPQPARVFAVNKKTGAPLWSTQIDSTTMSYVTHSAIVANGTAFVGVASNEELVAGFVPKAYGWQFTFRGSIVALDVKTGAIKWKTYTVPAGYSGGSIWGSTGAVDIERNQVYMATGNNFSVPDSVAACLQGGGTPAACMSPDNHLDSIIALDMSTGAIKWAAKGLPYDAFNVGCGLNIPGVFYVPANDNCPNPAGPDWDFAQGPMLLGGADTDGGQLVGAGQKSGMFWVFNAKNGQPVWSTQVGPGGLTGGMQWGSANDGKRVYVAVANSGLAGAGQNPGVWTLKDGNTTTAGGWAALDRKTGAVLWTTRDPAEVSSPGGPGHRAEAAVSVANDVVFGCNLDPVKGTMYALDARTGNPLWSFDSGGACNAGPSIADGMVFWGSGTFSGYGPKKVFAFGL